LATETEVAKRAQEMAEELLKKARNTSQEIRMGSEIYAAEILSKLENNLLAVLETVRMGQEELNNVDKTDQVS
jgi:hypothetical protein